MSSAKWRPLCLGLNELIGYMKMEPQQNEAKQNHLHILWYVLQMAEF